MQESEGKLAKFLDFFSGKIYNDPHDHMKRVMDESPVYSYKSLRIITGF